MQTNKLTIAYMRLSDEDIEKNTEYSKSIYNQTSLIYHYAKRMGLHIDKEYIDDGYSGINFNRPSFERLKDDIEDGKIDTIITKDMSRLGREFIETAYYITKYFPSRNVRYIAINDQYDSNDPNCIENELLINIQAIINDTHVKDTSEKRKQINYNKIKNGEFIGSIAPYGYNVVKKEGKKTLEIDEESAKIVKRIYKSIIDGKDKAVIAKELNDEGILPPFVYKKMKMPKGKTYYLDWEKLSLLRIIKNRVYMGCLTIRKYEKKNYKQKKVSCIPYDKQEYIEGVFPAIVTKEEFLAANEKIRKIASKEKNEYDKTFEKIVKCGICGNTMTASRRKKESGNVHYYFECFHTIRRKECPNRTIADSKLKNIVIDSIKELVETYIDGEKIINSATEYTMKKNKYKYKIDNYENEIDVHNKRIKNLYLEKTSGKITLEEFIESKRKEDCEKSIKEEELRKLIAENDISQKKIEITQHYKEFLNGDILLKDYIKNIIEKIVIYKDNTVEIVYKFGIGNTKTIKLY